jgi:hypothetical protein
MFANTIALAGEDLVRINQDNYSSEYLFVDTDKELRLSFRHSKYVDKKRGVTVNRHNVEFLVTIFNADPAIAPKVRKNYAVIENDNGDIPSEIVTYADALTTFLTTDALLTSLVGWES